MNRIYLDNNATTPIDLDVFDTMCPYFKEVFGNPSSQHTLGVEAQRAVTDSRNIIAQALGVNEREVVFTSGATESVNMALNGIAKANTRLGKHIVTSSVEHECILEACRKLEEEGYVIQYINPDKYGRIDSKKVVDAIRDDTVMVAIMHVNNELGTINDVEEIAREVKGISNNIYVFIDGAQAFGKIKIDLKHIDLYAFSAHKIHGPKGVGGLYIKESTKIRPLIVGGGQEFNFRGGTENVPGIIGLGKATEIAYKDIQEHRDHISELKAVFLEGLEGLEFTINSPDDALENTLNISFVGIRAEHLMHMLEEKGVYVSTGSACSTNKKIKSHVLLGIGASDEIKDSAIRISFSRMNTKEEVLEAVGIFKDIIEKI